MELRKMKRILISLVSEMTIPNILVACQKQADILWFISTPKMEREGRTEWIKNALVLRGCLPQESNIGTRIVDQDSLEDCKAKIQSLIEEVEEEVEFTLNMTGGNKVMAIAAYDILVKSGHRLKIGYMPIGRSEFIQIFPERKPLKVNRIEQRLNLEEYLAGYGFKIQNKAHFPELRDKVVSRRETSEWIFDNYAHLTSILDQFYRFLGEKRSHRKCRFDVKMEAPLTEMEKQHLNRNGFEVCGADERQIRKDLSKHEIQYWTGGWFEEYVFDRINELRCGGILDDCMLGMKIESSGGSSNDLDVAFMKDNCFYYVECKTLGDESDATIINHEVYKKSAISTLLGKGEKRAFICTTHSKCPDHLKNRAADYGIEILTIDQTRALGEVLKSRFG
jgi:hypothetical protein